MVASGKAERYILQTPCYIAPGLNWKSQKPTIYQGSCVPLVASGKAERWYGFNAEIPLPSSINPNPFFIKETFHQLTRPSLVLKRGYLPLSKPLPTWWEA